MAEVILNKNNFEMEVMNSNMPVLIDFWATWCGPCQMLAPVIEDIAKEYEGKVKVCKVNVDEEAELAAQFGVNAIPTLVVIQELFLIQSVGINRKGKSLMIHQIRLGY